MTVAKTRPVAPWRGAMGDEADSGGIRVSDAAHARRRDLVILCVIALLFRLPAALFDANHHPDEIWQYLEQGYGIAFGRAVTPWEYREGIRTWLLPTLFAGPLWLAGVVLPPTANIVVPLRVLIAIFSLSIVVAVYAMAARWSRWHAVVAAAVMATAFELSYFGAHALSDSIAPCLFMLAAMFAYRPGRGGDAMVAVGALFGLCFCVRFQLGPAIAAFLLIRLHGDWRAWGLVLVGVAAALLVDGAIDAVNGAVPLRWIGRNVWLNMVVNRSATYGVEGPLWYLFELAALWRWMTVPLFALAAIGASRFPALAAAAAVNIAFHSLIPHKEYRFILFSVVVILFLAGFGAAEVTRRLMPYARRWQLVAGLLVFWLAVGVTVGSAPAGGPQWRSMRNVSGMMRAAGRRSDVCALAVSLPGSAIKAAYVYYRRDTPIYFFEEGGDAVRMRSAYNAILTTADRAAMLGPSTCAGA